MSLTKTKQPFLALSKICLNNWHYIDQKILTFNNGINFFTGHSGSGKSTVIDAMQIVLYANTDGRGFFNKAAADDSDRNLIEYLRGMVAVGEKDEVTYLRNKNFSTTIVLEFTQTESDEKECLGVVFDVDTARNRECLPYGRTCDDNFGTPQIYAEKLQKRRFLFWNKQREI